MAFKILIDDRRKDRSIRELYDFINNFQTTDWGLFYYGFGLDRTDLKRRPKCGSIPTNHGCIIFPLFYYDETRFVKYAEGHLPKDKLADLRKKLREDKFIDVHTEVEKDVVRKIASEHPDAVESVAIELILPAIIKTETNPQTMEDAAMFYEKQSQRMKGLVEFCKKVPPPFTDVEVHQWNMHYADSRDVEEAVKNAANEEGEDLTHSFLYETIGDLEEEPEEKSYVIILRTDQDAKLTLRQLEKNLDKALAPIRRHISRKTTFITLVL